MIKYLLPAVIAFSLFADEIQSPQILRTRPIADEPKTSRTVFNGEFLYWIPQMDGLTYVQERISPPKGGGYKLSPREIKGTYEPGFRVNAGHVFDEKGWDIGFTWTHYRNAQSVSFSGKGTPMIVPQPPEPEPEAEHQRHVFRYENPEQYKPLTNFAKGKWRLIQNIADFEVGRRFPVGESFLGRAFVGLRDAIFHNKTQFSYSYDPETLILGISEIASKSKYWGLGPRIGGSAAYEFGYGLGVFALGSGSFLLGHFDSTFNGVFDDHPGVSLATTLQIETGLQWKKAFQKGYRVAFQFAWEQNFYNDINPSLSHLETIKDQGTMVPLSMDEGDLLMKGWTASCQFDY